MIENLHQKSLDGKTGENSHHIIRYDNELIYPLYKATQREYLNRLMRKDEVYLNTFFNLANQEAYGRGVGDVNEGSRQLLYTGKVLSDFPISNMVSAVNSYMFCCTSAVTRKLISVWKPTAAYKIKDMRFFEAISEVMASETTTTIIAPVHYGDWMDFDIDTRRVSEWMERNNEAGVSISELNWPSVAYMKDVDLSYQCEVRATWEPPFSFELQKYHEVYGDEFKKYADIWENSRLSLLSQNGVRYDLQPKCIRVPGIRRYVEEIDLTLL